MSLHEQGFERRGQRPGWCRLLGRGTTPVLTPEAVRRAGIIASQAVKAGTYSRETARSGCNSRLRLPDNSTGDA